MYAATMHYSSILQRFLAMLIDWAILLIPCAIAGHIIPVLGALVVVFFYYPVFESSKIQSTIGKHLMGIQVVGLNGERIDFRTACLRLILKLVSMLFLFIGHFFVFFTEQKQAFHDLIAGTIVTYGRNETVSVADAWVFQVREIFGVKSGDGG
jgi:uncharacterized RDD family membrane protein YckC